MAGVKLLTGTKYGPCSVKYGPCSVKYGPYFEFFFKIRISGRYLFSKYGPYFKIRSVFHRIRSVFHRTRSVFHRTRSVFCEGRRFECLVCSFASLYSRGLPFINCCFVMTARRAHELLQQYACHVLPPEPTRAVVAMATAGSTTRTRRTKCCVMSIDDLTQNLYCKLT